MAETTEKTPLPEPSPHRRTRLDITRRDGQSFIIHGPNGPAVIKLINSDRGRAEFTIEAPRSTIIERLEVAAPLSN